jgi:hypothetical protein
LLRVASKVVLYDAPERTLDNIPTFLVQVIACGSLADVKPVERCISLEEFRKALRDALAVMFTKDAWVRWHEILGILPIPPLPRRRFPDGSLGPEPGRFFRTIGFHGNGRGAVNGMTKFREQMIAAALCQRSTKLQRFCNGVGENPGNSGQLTS